MIKTARSKFMHIVISLLTIVGLFAHPTNVYAADVTVTAVCNVTVTFKATVPASVRQGESFTVSNIAISPSNSYGFTVSSSIYDFVATNTSSTTYHQNFVSTSPSPTTGHNTYWAYYPNWVVNATGAVGSSVVVTIKKSVTVVQGYGTVNCNFNKVFFSIPITAPASSPSPSPSQSASPSPTSSGGGGTKPSSSPSKSSTPKPGTPQQSQSPSVTATPTPEESNSPDSNDAPESPTVVPLIVKVRDGSGRVVPNAEVSLNGDMKIKTDKNGVVKFENVLTGNHSLTVSYKGKNISHTIYVDDQDVGTATVISLPQEPLIANPFVIGGIVAGVLALGTPIAIFAIRRYNSRPGLNIPEGAIPLHGIASGDATPALAETKISHIPAIAMFDSQPATQTPAPWDTVPLVQPVPTAPLDTATVPEQPPAAVQEPDAIPSIILPQAQPAPMPQPEPAVILPQIESTPVAPQAPVPREPLVAPATPASQPEASVEGSIEAAISAQVAAPLPTIQKFAPMTPTASSPVQPTPLTPMTPQTAAPVSVPVQTPPQSPPLQ